MHLIWGYTIQEIGALLGIIGALATGIAWIFKKIIAKPFMDRFDNLTHSMDNLTAQLDESKQDRLKLHHKANKHEMRIGRVETRLDFVEKEVYKEEK
ncbi:TPA_asm: hypothetical protein GEV19_02820 [Listeria monocytogenes]|nr:hypothetical protein [Listeria monocytogenes]